MCCHLVSEVVIEFQKFTITVQYIFVKVIINNVLLT